MSYCFTARYGLASNDFQTLFQNVPDLDQPGAGLRFAEGCAWETLDLKDYEAEVRLILLPASGEQLGEELQKRLSKAKRCRSTLCDNAAPESLSSSMAIVDRRVIIEVDNRTEETFVFDGDWFDGGGW